MKNLRLSNYECWTGWRAVQHGTKAFNIAIFSDTVNMILCGCMMVLFIEFYLFFFFFFKQQTKPKRKKEKKTYLLMCHLS